MSQKQEFLGGQYILLELSWYIHEFGADIVTRGKGAVKVIWWYEQLAQCNGIFLKAFWVPICLPKEVEVQLF